MIKEENYSIQAKNLMEMIIEDCENSLMNFQRDSFLVSEIKKLRFNLNNRIRKISDLSELKTDLKSNTFKVIVYIEPKFFNFTDQKVIPLKIHQ